MPADFFLWGPIEGKSVQKYTPHNRTTQRRYTPRDSSRQRRHFGKGIPEFGETHSSVLGCERRPVSASIMSRSCFASFPVCVYKFSNHYLNNIIFYRQQFGASSERLILYISALSVHLIIPLLFNLIIGLFIYCYSIKILNNSNYFNYKYFAGMKVTVYGNRLPRGTQMKKNLGTAAVGYLNLQRMYITDI